MKKFVTITAGKVTAVRTDTHSSFALPTPWVDVTDRAGPIGTGSPYDSAADTFGPPPPPEDEEN